MISDCLNKVKSLNQTIECLVDKGYQGIQNFMLTVKFQKKAKKGGVN
jgi:hypothetical protein